MPNFFGIDVETYAKKQILRRLRRLKNIHEAKDGGAYRHDQDYSQIHVATTWSEEDLDNWLYRTGQEYVGVFEIKPFQLEQNNG